MPSIESTCGRFFQNRDWLPKCLLGGLLAFIPILNIFALGYLFRYAEHVMRRGNFDLPDWEDWPALFIDGLKMLLMVLLFIGVPMLIGAAISFMITWVSFGILGVINSFPVSLALLFGPGFLVVSLFRFQAHHENWSTLFDVKSTFSMIAPVWPHALIGSIFLMGIWLLGLPLFGFTFFIGFLFLICYFSLIIRN